MVPLLLPPATDQDTAVFAVPVTLAEKVKDVPWPRAWVFGETTTTTVPASAVGGGLLPPLPQAVRFPAPSAARSSSAVLFIQHPPAALQDAPPLNDFLVSVHKHGR